MRYAKGVYIYETQLRDGRPWWRVVGKLRGERRSKGFPAESEARRFAAALAAEYRECEDIAMIGALYAYGFHLRTERELRSGSAATTERRLWGLVQGVEWLDELTPKRAQELADEYRESHAATTTFNVIGQARSWGRWMAEKGWVAEDPFAKVKVYGKRKKGKPTLTRKEARQLMQTCLEAAAFGSVLLVCGAKRRDRSLALRAGACGVVAALLLGGRASEVAGIALRDLDDDVVWIRGTKTANAERDLDVPDVLAAALDVVARSELNRHRLYYWAKKLCRAAGVPELSSQSLRATHATIARRAGATSELVAAQLGHGSTAVTEAHYIEQGASREADQRKAVLTLLKGGAA